MSYKVIPTEKFRKEAKHLIKKYPSLKDELLDLSSYHRVKEEYFSEQLCKVRFRLGSQA
jgi:mRNA-degrading endonuclease RelE of RelBE toxin-antitoxin system